MSTAIERALLQSLSDLQSEHEQQLNAWSNALQSMQDEHVRGLLLWAEATKNLQGQYEQTRAENAFLAQQVQSLSRQVRDLAECVEDLSYALRR